MRVEPVMADQEHQLGYAYWEGAVTITAERNGETISGVGYVELTGYASSMQGEF
jgi:predicted secreted hydrolase